MFNLRIQMGQQEVLELKGRRWCEVGKASPCQLYYIASKLSSIGHQHIRVLCSKTPSSWTWMSFGGLNTTPEWHREKASNSNRNLTRRLIRAASKLAITKASHSSGNQITKSLNDLGLCFMQGCGDEFAYVLLNCSAFRRLLLQSSAEK